jgi:MFS family permease
MATAVLTPAPRDNRTWLKHGVAGGILAGIIFMAFWMMAAALTMGATAVFTPLRMIGAIVLGVTALDSTTVAAVVAGAIVHLVLSAIFGAVFGVGVGAMVGAVPPLLRSTRSIIVVGTAFGFALWPINFYFIAPWAGWSWFPSQSNPVVQVVAHTVFFGTTLGIYLADRIKRARVPTRSVQTPERVRRAG